MSRWSDFNGPGKGITEQQLEEILAQYGIYPEIIDGQKGYSRKQFEDIWQYLDEKAQGKPPL